MPSSSTAQNNGLDDAARLAAVAATRLLDTPGEEAFDRIARLAARQCRAHAAFIALVDEAQVFCKSRTTGLSGRVLLWPTAWSRSASLCARIVATRKPLALPAEAADAMTDAPELSLPGVATVAGVPLLQDGHAIGALCVTDTMARTWGDDDLAVLQDLAACVATEIELRMSARRLERVQESFDSTSETLRLAMAAAQVSTFEWDIVQDHIAWSDNLEGFLGLVPGTFKGTFDAFMALVHPDDRERVREALRQAAAQGRHYSCNFRMLRTDGGVRWTETRGRLVCDAQGQPVRLFGVDVDVTRHREAALAQEAERQRLAQALDDRSRTEQALRESEARLRLALQVSSAICFEWDIEHDRVRRLMSSEEALQATEDAPDTFAGVMRVVHPDDRALFHDQVHAALRRPDGHYSAQYRIVRADASVRWLSEYGRVEFNAQGQPKRLVGVSHDDTERHESEQERERCIALLRDDDRRKDEFLATLAHELRNPLAPIRSAVQLLETCAGLEPVAQKACAIIDRQSLHLTRMVEDLLDISRIAAGKVVLQREVHDVRTVVEASVELARPLIAARQHQLEVRLPASPGLYVEGDAPRLTQALGNVIRNAAKYTPPHGRIEVVLGQADGNRVEVRVVDNGMGIDAALLPRVFELFVQGDAVAQDSGGGLGVGLALVRKLVELHGGSVSAHSDGPGRGACFTILLPQALAEAVKPPASAGPAQGRASATKRRVLLVEDNRDAAEALTLLLKMEGHEVIHCTSGMAGRDRACAERFDAVLLDISLPDMSGLAVAQAVRSGGASRTATLIAVSGHGQPEERARATRAGFDDYLVKPVDMPILLSRLAAARHAIPTTVLQHIGDARLYRFYAAWQDLRGAQRWPGAAQLLAATESLETHRVVVEVRDEQPKTFKLRIVALGSALAAMLPKPIVGSELDSAPGPLGSVHAAFAQVVRSGVPSHECVEYKFGPNEQLRFERLIVPASDDVAAPRPSCLVALVSFDSRPLSESGGLPHANDSDTSTPSPVPPADSTDFDAPALARQIEALTREQIDALPFGAIRVDQSGVVQLYSRTEATLSGRGDRPTVGLHFFFDIAPCMNTPLVRGRIEQALASGSLDVRLRHVGDFADRARLLEIRALSATDGGFWLFLRRI